MDKSEIARALKVGGAGREKLRAELAKMVRKGYVVQGRQSRYQMKGRKRGGMPGTGDLIGVIRFQPNGHAWFYPQLDNEENKKAGLDLDKYDRVFIHGRNTGVALDGDKVIVHLLSVGPKREEKHRRGRGKPRNAKGGDWRQKKAVKRDEAAGKVVKVVERGNSKIIGTYFKRGKFSYVQPDMRAYPATMELEGDNLGAKSGQKVVVELISWKNKFSPPRGRIVEVLGWPDDAGVDIISVIHKHGLKQDFPEGVLKEAAAVPVKISAKELERREDWRDALVLTVDPADAKDFDDALCVRELKNGGWELAVFIADVSHYVKPGTALDVEAERRGNSTYLVDRVLPMLPEKISNNVCSLMPEVDRLTKCAVMVFDKTGRRVSARFCDAVIHSKKRLSYEEAQVFLMQGGGGEVGDALRRTWALASVLRKKRFAEGALDLEFTEMKVVLDDDLKAVDVVNVVHNESHQMVEECMLAANEAVAVELKMRRKNAIYRIHEDPDFDKLNEFAEKARAQGFKVGDLTNKKHIQALLDKAKGTPLEDSIKIGLLKSLKRAAYSVEPLGHYGLAKMDYCHFTSPIRRYADLVVHRAIQGLLVNPPKKIDHNPKLTVLAEIAQHISETERKSAEAEMETKRMKMMEYMELCAEHPEQVRTTVFEALVTDVRNMGLFVEIADMRVRGLVRIEDMPGRAAAGWRLQEHRHSFINKKGDEIKLGMKLKVEIVRIDKERKMVDFRVVE